MARRLGRVMRFARAVPGRRAQPARALAALALIAHANGAPACERPASLEAVIERNHLAVNGAIGGQGLDLRLSMIEERTSYDLRIRLARPALLRADLYRFGVPVYSEGHGATGAWEQGILRWSPRAASEKGAEALRTGAEWLAGLRSLRELRERGAMLSAAPAAPSSDCAVRLTVAFPHGVVRAVEVDLRSGLVVRSEQTVALHPDFDGQAGQARRIVATFSDFRPVAGATIPFRTESRDAATGELVQTIVVHSAIAAPIDPAVFDGR